jgi:hypothetical protein
MEHWKKTFPDSILEVVYEEVVADTEGQTRRILDFLEMPWDDKCLEFHKTKKLVNTASSEQVRKPIYKSSVERWRRYEKHLGPLIKALGDLVPENVRAA